MGSVVYTDPDLDEEIREEADGDDFRMTVAYLPSLDQV